MQSKSKYISYERAMAQLRERLDATPEEVAAWVCMTEPKQVCAKLNEKSERCGNEVIKRGDICEKHGGLPMPEDEVTAKRQRSLYAYLSARELDPPPPFLFGNHIGEPDYLPLLCWLYFKADDVAQFEPRERFITGRALLVRLTNEIEMPPGTTLDQWHEKQSEHIRKATKECRLNPFHPTLGLTEAANTDDPFYATLEEGLFSMTEVKAYVREEFGVEAMTDAKKSNERPLLQQKFQENEILRVIRVLSQDPKKLPKSIPGKPGIKAEVRQALTFQPKVFDKAWERLRANQDIQDAE